MPRDVAGLVEEVAKFFVREAPLFGVDFFQEAADEGLVDALDDLVDLGSVMRA